MMFMFYFTQTHDAGGPPPWRPTGIRAAEMRQADIMMTAMEELLRRWRQLGFWFPIAFVGTVTSFAILVAGRFLPDVVVVALITAVSGLGAAVFSSWVFSILGRAQRESEQQGRELAAINEASLALSSDLQLDSVLQRVVDLSRKVARADYGALGLLSEQGEIVEFLTSGISDEQRERIGQLPRGKGLLGVVLHGGERLRVDRIADDPRSSGFPPYHPPMTSFIGLPIVYEERIVGDLYLTDKNGGEPFTRQDEEMLSTLAAHAAIAIENARLYGQVQDLAVLEERDRIGMDLHDGVIQSLYATGLTLENALEDLDENPGEVRPQLQKVIRDLNQTISDIRSYIFSLRPTVLAETDLAGACGALLRELKVNALLEVELIEEQDACRGLTLDQVAALYHVAQESLTNVRKHAQARSVSAHLEQQDGMFKLTITDDGVGFDPTASGAGQGLENMRERLAAMGGRLQVESRNGRGTRLTAEVPVTQEEALT